MPLLSVENYVRNRQAYDYCAPNAKFSIIQTIGLTNVGEFQGIFATIIRNERGVNLRKFELVCQEVFNDCLNAKEANTLNKDHVNNLKNVAGAIVHWKMASQGGRATNHTKNMLRKFDDDLTTKQLLEAFRNKDLAKFRIGGVRIPTATTFLRFLFPDDFGIMDSRVVGNYTQPNGITTLNVRHDGYIIDTNQNIHKFHEEYIAFLRKEAAWLNSMKALFRDRNVNGETVNVSFRPCDVEMALFL